MLLIFLGCPPCQETPHFTGGSCCGVNSSSFYRPRRDGRLSRPRKLLHTGFEPGSLAPQAATLPLRHTAFHTCIYIHVYITFRYIVLYTCIYYICIAELLQSMGEKGMEIMTTLINKIY